MKGVWLSQTSLAQKLRENKNLQVQLIQANQSLNDHRAALETKQHEDGDQDERHMELLTLVRKQRKEMNVFRHEMKNLFDDLRESMDEKFEEMREEICQVFQTVQKTGTKRRLDQTKDSRPPKRRRRGTKTVPASASAKTRGQRPKRRIERRKRPAKEVAPDAEDGLFDSVAGFWTTRC